MKQITVLMLIICLGFGFPTAAQSGNSSPRREPEIGLDTCPSPGLDPTDNFMDTSGDACWTNFTAGQNERMASMFAVYRFGQ